MTGHLRRGWLGMFGVVLLGPAADTPTMHALTDEIGSDETIRGRTYCGRVADMSSLLMPTVHAEKFCRPCLVCAKAVTAEARAWARGDYEPDPYQRYQRAAYMVEKGEIPWPTRQLTA